jgi:site-specific DNA-methyltransferase (adenine-specific)
MYNVNDIRNTIIQGNAVEVLRNIPDSSVDMVITSPPYFGLRKYSTNQNEVGREKSVDEYLSNLISVFTEVKRVVKSSGSVWVNIGDAFVNKCLLQVPSRFAIKMADEIGLILRNTIIWKKSNALPSSVRTRFTSDYEFLYFFVKDADEYFFECQYEPLSKATIERNKYSREVIGGKSREYGDLNGLNNHNAQCCSQGRIMRSVWEIPTQSCKTAHFATFPNRLIETPIKASCPEFICNLCQKPRKITYEKINNDVKQQDRIEMKSKEKAGIDLKQLNTAPSPDLIQQYKATGLSNCDCNADFSHGIVLDVFMGAGTTAIVSKKLGRDYIGIELSQEYVDMANERISI